jgi:ATP-dependent protease Clp ATPase subunit
MSNVINFTEPPKPQLKCSFCGKAENHVERMVSNQLSGKEAREICNECIEKCTKLLEVTE